MPLLGQIAAGIPLDMTELAEETFTMPRRLVGRGDLFMLRVRGDSMTGAAIEDGDLVVVRRQQDAENGEIVAARIGDEVVGQDGRPLAQVAMRPGTGLLRTWRAVIRNCHDRSRARG